MIPLRNLNEFNGMVAFRFHSYSLPIADSHSSTGTTTGTDEAAVGASAGLAFNMVTSSTIGREAARPHAAYISDRAAATYPLDAAVAR